MSDIPCPRPECDQPTKDGLLCHQDTSALRHALKSLPDAFRDLDLTVTRQDRIGGGSKRKGRETPLPFNVAAAETQDVVVMTIATWIRELAESYGEALDVETLICGGSACTVVVTWAPGRTMREWCAWLLDRTYRIRGHQAVDQIWDELLHCAQAVAKAVDRPADWEFAGFCDICSTALYAAPGSAARKAMVQCRQCAEVAEDGYVPEYDVAARRQEMMDKFRTGLATAQEILTACPRLYNVEINSSTFRSWVLRRDLLPQGQNAEGQPLYSVEGVIDLAGKAAERAALRKTRKRVLA